MEFKTVDHTVKLEGSPHRIYEMLMDSEQHSGFTGGEAKISREVGGEFTIMGGGLGGKNLELVEDRKIVQSWRAGDWPEGHYSTATFLLEEEEGGTRLSFVQAGVPAESYKSINEGWRTYYWVPMSKVLVPLDRKHNDHRGVCDRVAPHLPPSVLAHFRNLHETRDDFKQEQWAEDGLLGIVVSGVPGCGKSKLAQHLLFRQSLENYLSAVILDPIGDLVEDRLSDAAARASRLDVGCQPAKRIHFWEPVPDTLFAFDPFKYPGDLAQALRHSSYWSWLKKSRVTASRRRLAPSGPSPGSRRCCRRRMG